MDKKTTGIVATIVAVVLCGCPGLFSLCFGAISMVAGFVPGSNININGNSDPQSAIYMGLVTLCLGIIFVAIPIVVGFLMLRKKPAPAPVSMAGPNEPIPPAL